MKFRSAGAIRHSSVNGPGVRYVLFFQGCPHHCRACQNPETWNPLAGKEADTDEVLAEIFATRYLDGVTLSGGDPLYQPDAAAAIAKACREHGLSVWAYTGWTWEDIRAGRAGRAAIVLPYLDVLVDGPFVLRKKDGTAIWRGSSNQRLIDAAESLRRDTVCLWQEKDMDSML